MNLHENQNILILYLYTTAMFVMISSFTDMFIFLEQSFLKKRNRQNHCQWDVLCLFYIIKRHCINLIEKPTDFDCCHETYPIIVWHGHIEKANYILISIIKPIVLTG